MIAHGIDPPTLRAGRDPSHPEAIIARRDVHAKGFERSCHGFDPVRFLYAQLRGSRDDGLAARHRRSERDQRQLVDQPRNLLGADARRDQLSGAHLQIRDGLAAHRPPIEDRDVRAHPREHVDQPGAERIHVNALDEELGAAEQGRRDDERRRR